MYKHQIVKKTLLTATVVSFNTLNITGIIEVATEIFSQQMIILVKRKRTLDRYSVLLFISIPKTKHNISYILCKLIKQCPPLPKSEE